MRVFQYCLKLACTLVIVSFSPLLLAQQRNETDPVIVEYAQTQSLSRNQFIQAVGTLSPVASIIIKAEVAGKVASIHFKEAQTVKAGDLLIALNDDIAKANLNDAKAKLKIAKLNFDRLTAAKQTATAQQLDTAESALLQAEANWETAQAQWEKTQIRAPFTGTVGLTNIELGSYIQAGEALTRLTDSSQLKLDFNVPERFASLIQAGQLINFSTDNDPTQHFQAKIYAISPEIDPNGRFLSLRALFDNTQAQLIAGLFARIEFEIVQNGEVIVVPEEAVFAQNNKHWVYVVQKQPDNPQQERAKLTEVTISQRKPGIVEIANGLTAKTQVVSAGILKLRDGALIRNINAPKPTEKTESMPSGE